MKKIKEKLGCFVSGRKVFISACALSAIVVSGSIITYAASTNGYEYEQARANSGWTSTITGNHYNSYGKINYTDGTNTVVVDAADIATIDYMVGEGKNAIKDAIKSVDADDRLGTSAWTDTTYPDFANLAILISSSQTLADDKKETQAVNSKGENLYYKNQDASDTYNLTQTCTDDTGLPVYYREAIAANLTAGTAAYINGELILGTGLDNETYYDLGYIDGYNKDNDYEINYTYHNHVDGEGNIINKTSNSVSGGCFNNGKHTHTASCSYTSVPTTNHDIHNIYVGYPYCWHCDHCGSNINSDTNGNIYHECTWSGSVKKYTCGEPYNIWYTNCGKTTGQIESATIIFN